jgi:alkylated DNA repair protein alkB family protein 7
VITSYRESLLTAFPESSNIHPTIPYPAILKRVYGLLPASPGAELARGLYESLVLPVSESGSPASSTSRSATRTAIPSPSESNAPNPSGEEDWEPFAAPLQTTTHALHLSPTGRIDPHVDNVDASGSVIIGVSLGAERILRLERKGAENEGRAGWEVLLNSGSVYVQK